MSAHQAAPARWSVAVFGRNEAARIGACLRAIARAGREAGPDVALHVTVLLNGTTDGSPALAATALRAAGLEGAVYEVPHPDKSHALNLFLHALRPPAALYVCIDAYAEIWPDSLNRLAARLERQPEALAAAAVPSSGRSAAALRQGMLRHSGLHGSLFALRAAFVERLAAAGLRLPVGLYRGDGLLGSFLLHDLDAAQGGWEGWRIAVEPAASWTTPRWQPWRWQDLRRHLHRLVRQGRGRLESAALRSLIYAEGFAGLPADADAMLRDWIAADPRARRPRPWRDPFAWLALARLRHAAPPCPDSLRPRLVLRSEAACGRSA
ncbi:hypothetical protein [Falsiroseomonas sp.]|uniref:hypothetical protein n=1 Tax=Falsiroseomonas sp. TaxID=2870721 RepID=UPI003F709800